MIPFKSLTGTAAPLLDDGQLMANVDTDRIIPKQFLKTVARTGLSAGLFHELKTLSDGTPNPDFVLNQPEFSDASILIAGENFGCGSSREHAPWALLDQGLRCVIAPGFADIFYNNCLKNAILPVVLPAETCAKLAAEAGGGNHVFTVDLPGQTVTAPDGTDHPFEIDPAQKQNLIEGLDEIGATLRKADAIAAFETRRRLETPWLDPAPQS